MNAIMLFQGFVQVLKKRWAMRLECFVLITACVSAGITRWVNAEDCAVNDLKRMFAIICLVWSLLKKIVCHNHVGALERSCKKYVVCNFFKLKNSSGDIFFIFVFQADSCSIIWTQYTNLFFQTRTCLEPSTSSYRPYECAAPPVLFHCVLWYEIMWRKVGQQSSACLAGQGKEYCL